MLSKRSKGDQPARHNTSFRSAKENEPCPIPETKADRNEFASMDWDPTVLLKRAETCSRLADQTDDPIEAAKFRQLAREYDAKAKGMQSPPAAPDQTAPTAQERALAILREFEQAQKDLIGRAVVLSDGKAGSVEKVRLDELHGLRVTITGHEGDWPISTLRFTDDK